MITGEFKVGQKVRVRKDLAVGGREYSYYVNEDMGGFKGKEVTISFVAGNRIKLKENEWTWGYDMLEEIVPEVPKLPTKVLEIGQTAKLEIYVERVIVNDPATIMFYKTANYNKETGLFESWSDTKKIVSKCNKDIGDTFDIGKGVDIAILKAYRKEISKQLRKY